MYTIRIHEQLREGMEYPQSPIKRPQHCDLSVIWNDKRDESGYVYKPMKSEFSVQKPPFGLDEDRREIADEDVKTGYREGGPKEARLFRVALLASKKDVDHLHPVKIRDIPADAREDQLAEELGRFGAIGDVYIPRDLATGRAREFAIVRFEKEEAARKALAQQTVQLRGSKKVAAVDPLPKQWSTFTSNSGVNGITNEISDDMRQTEFLRNTRKLEFKQDVTLAECFSRSGYPWGSKQELKILEPHAPKEVMSMPAIRLTGLHEGTSSDTLRQVFLKFGPSLGDVYCPKSLLVIARSKNQNDGVAFVRYSDKRDFRAALRDVEAGLVVVDGRVLEGGAIEAYSRPTEQTRRYF